jgi:hypothetical protein
LSVRFDYGELVLTRLSCGRLCTIALLALVPAMAWAQQPPPIVIHPAATQSPILITAAKLSVKHGFAVFSGNVLVSQTDEPELYCSRLIVRWRRPLAAHKRDVIDRLVCEP